MPALSTRGAASAKGFGLTGFVPALPDPYFKNTVLLLPGNGTNGAQNNTFLDSSSNNFSITRNGDTTQGTFSPFSQTGWSNYFAGPASVGGDQYLLIPFNSALSFGTGDFTYECWFFNYLDYQSNAGFIDLGDANASGSFAVFMNGGDFIVRIGGLGNDLSFVASSIAKNNWYHLAVVRSGSTLTTYINGVARASGTRGQNVTQGSPYIGSIRPQYSIKLQGNLSNVRIVKGTAVYTSNFTPPTAPLTAISGTSLLTCQSNRFIDNSSNNFAFTINGTPSVQAFSPFNPTAPYDPAVNGGSVYLGTAPAADYLSTPTSSNLTIGTGAFQIDFWMYPTETPNRFCGPLGTNLQGIFLSYRWGSFGLDFTNNSDTAGVISAPYPRLNEWHHVTLVRNSAGVRSYYIDGVRIGSLSNAVDFNQTLFTIGTYSASFGSWPGFISNFRVIVGSNAVDPNASTIAVPTALLTAVSGTQLLCNFTNAGIRDATGKNDLVTVGNAQISTAQSKFGGGALAFDGNGDAVISAATPLFQLSTSWTIEGWFNTTSRTGDMRYITVEGSSYQVGLICGGGGSGGSTNDLVLNRFGSGDWIRASGILTGTDGTWNHIAIVCSNGTIKLYFNGVNVGGTSTNTMPTGNCFITVGASVNYSSYSYNGYQDDIRVTTGIARYTGNFTPPTKAFPTK